ncbi:ABC transporter permease [Nocardioides sp. KR10-350]|uniref:ABC transporter permease n=1 Tax=Nocardioides cheoyonin TaxID=3156615 RepID=UPI0032B5F3E7
MRTKTGSPPEEVAALATPTPADPPDAPLAEALLQEPRRRQVPAGVYYLASVVVGIGIWWIAAVAGTNELLPTPGAVARAGWDGLRDGDLLTQTWASLRRVLIGFLLGVAVAVPTGFLMGWYRWANSALEPWVQFFRTIPPLALIPLVIIFLGVGESAKISLIFLAAYLSCVIAVVQGVRNVDRVLLNAARVLGAKDRHLFVKVVVPASLPYLFVGMRVALGNAWATLVAAELIAADTGLGHMMKTAGTYFEVPTVIVGVIVIGILGMLMDRVVLYLDRRLTRWQDKSES